MRGSRARRDAQRISDMGKKGKRNKDDQPKAEKAADAELPQVLRELDNLAFTKQEFMRAEAKAAARENLFGSLPPHSSLLAMRSRYEQLLSRSTDLKPNNERDVLGDGDQTKVVHFPGKPGQDLMDVWSEGADW